MKSRIKERLLLVLLVLAGYALAAGAGLPRYPILQMLDKVLTRWLMLWMPIMVIAIMVAMALAFGAEAGESTRRTCLVIMAIGFLIVGLHFMIMLFGASAAVM